LTSFRVVKPYLVSIGMKEGSKDHRSMLEVLEKKGKSNFTDTFIFNKLKSEMDGFTYRTIGVMAEDLGIGEEELTTYLTNKTHENIKNLAGAVHPEYSGNPVWVVKGNIISLKGEIDQYLLERSEESDDGLVVQDRVEIIGTKESYKLKIGEREIDISETYNPLSDTKNKEFWSVYFFGDIKKIDKVQNIFRKLKEGAENQTEVYGGDPLFTSDPGFIVQSSGLYDFLQFMQDMQIVECEAKRIAEQVGGGETYVNQNAWKKLRKSPNLLLLNIGGRREGAALIVYETSREQEAIKYMKRN